MANKVYAATETAITFKETSPTVSFTPKNIANNTGWYSAQWDRGAGSMPARYRWFAKTKAAAALAVGTLLEVYMAFARDGANTVIDGNLGTTTAALATADKRRNLTPVGDVEADSTTNGEVQQTSGVVWIFARYVSVVWWNTLGQALTNVAADHEFILVPEPDEIQ